jgi:putative ABC transport system permease protein
MWLDDLRHDVRFAIRSLLKQPGFTATITLTLALATGATGAIFSVVNAVLLRPLPFRAPDRLVQVFEIGRVGGPGAVFFGDLQEFRRQSNTFESFATQGRTTKHLEGIGEPERLTAILTDREFFRVLGVNPIAGRTFTPDDTGQVAVISARLWRERFNRAATLPGSTITLSGQRWDADLQRTVIDRRPFTVIGVMPETFQFPYGATTSFPGAMREGRTDLWIYDERDARGGRWSVIARMKPGVSVATAEAELVAIEARIDAQAPSPNRPIGVQLRPVAEVALESTDRFLWLLMGAVALALAAACANVANLMLARAIVRAREVATRVALGAIGLRLVRQFLAESVVLALAGGTLGVAAAWWGINILVAVGSAKIPRAHEIGLDWEVLAFFLLICLGTAVLVGLVPALSALRVDVTALSKESNTRGTSRPLLARLRDTLVVAEVALAFVLALGTALVMSSLSQLRSSETGMVTRNVVTFHMTPKVEDAHYLQLEQRVSQLPGVEAAGWIQLLPLQNWGWVGDYGIRGRASTERRTVELRTVTPGYFRALGIPLLAGRELDSRDVGGGPQAILVNQALVARDFPNENAVGRETDRGTIVGVVGDVRQVTLDRPATPEIYQPLGKNAGVATDLGLTLLVRSEGPRDALIAAVRATTREVNPALAIFNIKSMDQVIDESLWELNLYRWLIGLFAILALVLAVIGLYGVISYAVASRTKEFAIRLALGSDHSTLARLVLTRGLVLTGIGVVLGSGGAWALFQLLREWPVAAQPSASLFALVAALLAALSLLACAAPSLRVSMTNPARALRE